MAINYNYFLFKNTLTFYQVYNILVRGRAL